MFLLADRYSKTINCMHKSLHDTCIKCTVTMPTRVPRVTILVQYMNEGDKHFQELVSNLVFVFALYFLDPPLQVKLQKNFDNCKQPLTIQDIIYIKRACWKQFRMTQNRSEYATLYLVEEAFKYRGSLHRQRTRDTDWLLQNH